MTTLPYDYMPLVLSAIDLISTGQTETGACDQLRLSIKTFQYYIKSSPELQDAYDEAIRRGYDAMADALLRPDNHALYGHSDSKMAKVQSDNIKWFLEKRDPKRFGQRVEVNHHLTADKAITQALLSARNRVPLLDHEEVIDAEVIDMDEDARILAEIGLA